jgi:hypothetical protein
MDTTTATILSNEARRNELKRKIAAIEQELKDVSTYAALFSQTNADAQRRLASATAELSALESGAGPGLTADFGLKSSVTQSCEAERAAGKAAAIDYIKANPTCTQDDALAAYRRAALATRPADRQWLLCDPANVLREYMVHCVPAKIAEATWEAFAAFVVTTDKDSLLAL